MKVPAYLKPENGPLGRAFATWLDHAPKGLATRFLVLWFVLLYTAFAIISSASVGLHPDLLGSYALGLHPSAGYDHQAPLAALMAGAWFALFPPTDWAFHLLATVNAAVGLYATDRIARRCLDGDKRIAVLLLLLLTPFYQFVGRRFGADQTMLSTWPIATYCFLRAFETRGLAWSAAAGAAAALAMLGSYHSVLLLAGFVAAVLAHPGRWPYLRSASPWISVVVLAVALAPHALWLYATGFASLDALTAPHTDAPLAKILWKDAICLVEGIAAVAVLLAVYWIAVRPSRTTLRETFWPPDADGRMLVVVLAAPPVLWAVMAPFIGTAPTPLWTMPTAFLLPIVLLRPQAAELTRVTAIRITALVAVTAISTLAVAPWLAWRTHVNGTAEGREYYRPVSAEITNAWRLATGLPLRIVMGDRDLASAVTFYSPDHPDAMSGFTTPSPAPLAGEGGVGGGGWVTPERLAQEGWAAVCNADDEKCVDAARQRAAGKSNVQFITYSTISRYLGKPGKLGRFFFILAAPEARPVIQLQ